MAHTYKIVEVNTLSEAEPNSQDMSGLVFEYAPANPKAGDDFVIDTIQISEITVAEWEKVEHFLYLARWKSERGRGNKIFFEVDFDISAGRAAYRSEIVDGEFITAPSNLREDTANAKFSGTLILKRRAGWELKTPSDCTFTNPNATNQTTVNLYNCNDGVGSVPAVRANYANVGIGAPGIGEVPLRITLEYDGITGAYISNIVIGVLNNTTFAHNLEATSGTETADTHSSGGAFERHTLSGTLTALETWDLKTLGTSIENYMHENFIVAARFATAPPANTYVQMQMGRAGYAGPIVKLNANLFQLIDVVKIPPGELGASSEFSLIFSAKGSGDLDLDFLTLIPTESYVRLAVTTPIELADGDKIVIDSAKEFAYILDASTGISYETPVIGNWIKPQSDGYDGSEVRIPKLVLQYATGSTGAGADIGDGIGRFILSGKYHARLWTL